MTPRASVIVRSMDRLPHLCRLVRALLSQSAREIEVVVVDQSTRATDAERRELDALAQADQRLRVLRHPPLGGARARNVGVTAARGEILLFIDDDDLPVGDGWIAAHLGHYDDPLCLGVTGRQIHDPGEPSPYRSAARAHRRCMAFSPLLRLPWTYARGLEPKRPVDYVHGTNGSLRREAATRFGGWDEDAPIEDEASLGYRAARLRRDGEYFCFDPKPEVVRGQDVSGGLAKRFMTADRYFARLADFAHRVVARHHPARFALLYPLYMLALCGLTLDWIWTEARAYPTFGRRLRASARLIPALPLYVCAALLRRLGPVTPRASAAPTCSGTDSPGRSPAPEP